MLRAQSADEWEVVRIGLAQSTAQHLRAERGEPADPPEDPRPSLIRQIPPYGAPGLGRQLCAPSLSNFGALDL
jgi:hypothetical protein